MHGHEVSICVMVSQSRGLARGMRYTVILRDQQVVSEMSVPRSNCVTAVLLHNKVMFIRYENEHEHIREQMYSYRDTH